MAYFEELSIWQQAKDLTKCIYEMMQDNRDWGLRDQIQRASVSIMNNIAEGSESGSAPAYIRYLNIAKGSSAEVRSMLYLCGEFGYCTPEQQQQMFDLCKKISAGINNLIRYQQTHQQ